MLKRTFAVGLAFASVCACVFYWLSIPQPLQSVDTSAHIVDLTNGEAMFWAGGCASCHAAADAEGDEQLLLGGGVELETPFGLFRSPNISPDPQFGIGNWTTLNFVNAMQNGLSPDLQHYYPAFPYPHYSLMTLGDVVDLKAYLDTLPHSANDTDDHDLKFPYNVRRGIGLWKKVYLDEVDSQPTEEFSNAIERGRYLVQGPAHCGACHTPRDAFGGRLTEQFLAGAPSLESPGDANGESGAMIPNITPHKDGIGSWSERDISYSLETGFDPDFDSFGGSMVHVQENMARLSNADRAAIAAYLKTIPAIPSAQR